MVQFVELAYAVLKLGVRHYGAFSANSKKSTEGLLFHCAKCGLKVEVDNESVDETDQSSADSVGINMYYILDRSGTKFRGGLQFLV
jgi:hypothetical protein